MLLYSLCPSDCLFLAVCSTYSKSWYSIDWIKPRVRPDEMSSACWGYFVFAPINRLQGKGPRHLNAQRPTRRRNGGERSRDGIIVPKEREKKVASCALPLSVRTAWDERNLAFIKLTSSRRGDQSSRGCRPSCQGIYTKLEWRWRRLGKRPAT